MKLDRRCALGMIGSVPGLMAIGLPFPASAKGWQPLGVGEVWGMAFVAPGGEGRVSHPPIRRKQIAGPFDAMNG